jgi:hypothetical protein
MAARSRLLKQVSLVSPTYRILDQLPERVEKKSSERPCLPIAGHDHVLNVQDDGAR